jgi:hypothetical protein
LWSIQQQGKHEKVKADSFFTRVSMLKGPGDVAKGMKMMGAGRNEINVRKHLFLYLFEMDEIL